MRHLGYFGGLLAAGFTVLGPAAVSAEAVATDWAEAYKSRARLVAGTATFAGKEQVFAVAHIKMPPGWKTYWKNPGESGLPPNFEWDGSVNLASATVLYPAPSRISDKGGDIIGYQDEVLFPVAIAATDAAQPISLKLHLQYGICKDICIPADLTLALEVPANETGALPEEAVTAIEHVPRVAPNVRDGDPVLKRTKAELAGSKPRLTLEGTFPGGTDGAEIFLDSPDGAYLPLASKAAASGNDATFEVDLSEGVDVSSLKGKEITATLIGVSGQSSAQFKIE